jgi:peptidoglycan/xylan/chitin deacetylase (PgdA/CDA1 family)
LRKALPPLALTYHGIADVPLARDPHHLFVRPRDLRHQIQKLKKWGYELVAFGELARRVATGEARGSACVTFDDGFVDNLDTLVPLLQAEAVPATVFVVSGWLGRPHPVANWTRILDADEVRELASHGVEIGTHTETHPDLTTLSRDAARAEWERSRSALAELTLMPVDVGAYPFGHASAETGLAARDAGLRAACRTLGQGSWDDVYDLPRQAMENRAGDLGLWLKRHDRYEQVMRLYPARVARKVRRRIRERLG